MSREITLLAGVPQEFYEVADFFRILSAAAPLTVEFYSAGREVSEAVNVSKGYAEKFERGTFDRVRLISGTTQDVQFVTRLGNVVLYDAAPVGDTAIVSSVPLDLTAASIEQLLRPVLPSGSWQNTATMAANTPLTVFTAAANVNGAILLNAESVDVVSSNQMQAFVAKATAPATVFDGEVITSSGFGNSSGTNVEARCKLQMPARIAPGLGLFFISSVSGVSGLGRHARFRLL